MDAQERVRQLERLLEHDNARWAAAQAVEGKRWADQRRQALDQWRSDDNSLASRIARARQARQARRGPAAATAVIEVTRPVKVTTHPLRGRKLTELPAGTRLLLVERQVGSEGQMHVLVKRLDEPGEQTLGWICARDRRLGECKIVEVEQSAPAADADHSAALGSKRSPVRSASQRSPHRSPPSSRSLDPTARLDSQRSARIAWPPASPTVLSRSRIFEELRGDSLGSPHFPSFIFSSLRGPIEPTVEPEGGEGAHSPNSTSARGLRASSRAASSASSPTHPAVEAPWSRAASSREFLGTQSASHPSPPQQKPRRRPGRAGASSSTTTTPGAHGRGSVRAGSVARGSGGGGGGGSASTSANSSKEKAAQSGAQASVAPMPSTDMGVATVERAQSVELLTSSDLEAMEKALLDLAFEVEKRQHQRLPVEVQLGAALKRMSEQSAADKATFVANIVRDWDPNRDGYVSRMEFRSNVRSLLGSDAPFDAREVDALFEQLDSDSSGQLDPLEIKDALRRLLDAAARESVATLKVQRKIDTWRERAAEVRSVMEVTLEVERAVEAHMSDSRSLGATLGTLFKKNSINVASWASKEHGEIDKAIFNREVVACVAALGLSPVRAGPAHNLDPPPGLLRLRSYLEPRALRLLNHPPPAPCSAATDGGGDGRSILHTR
jgi:Ca2+-binding EF-hand superfamily protein